MKILANDGLDPSGIEKLKEKKFELFLDKIDQEKLIDFINQNAIEVLLVRSATFVRNDIIDACPCLKIIGRGGVGMDNIDVEYAIKKGLKVINTQHASSHSVAELVFSHLFGLARFLQDSNRNMPLSGDSEFDKLKKNYAKGIELKDQILGIIGFGRIGQTVAKIALGLQMNILVFDPFIKKVTLDLNFSENQKVSFSIVMVSKEEVLKNADCITLHIPAQKEYLIGSREFEIMKSTAFLINTSREGLFNEQTLINALDEGQISGAGLDVFENEPHPSMKILMHPKISLTPHIGAATLKAQGRIGLELADQIITFFDKS